MRCGIIVPVRRSLAVVRCSVSVSGRRDLAEGVFVVPSAVLLVTMPKFAKVAEKLEAQRDVVAQVSELLHQNIVLQDKFEKLQYHVELIDARVDFVLSKVDGLCSDPEVFVTSGPAIVLEDAPVSVHEVVTPTAILADAAPSTDCVGGFCSTPTARSLNIQARKVRFANRAATTTTDSFVAPDSVVVPPVAVSAPVHSSEQESPELVEQLVDMVQSGSHVKANTLDAKIARQLFTDVEHDQALSEKERIGKLQDALLANAVAVLGLVSVTNPHVKRQFEGLMEGYHVFIESCSKAEPAQTSIQIWFDKEFDKRFDAVNEACSVAITASADFPRLAASSGSSDGW